MNRETFIVQLYDIGAIQHGTFTLKSGIESPLYIDLRRIISHPAMLKTAAELLWQEIASCSTDLLCGVPYAALPFATVVSVEHNIPMIMRRKEQKEYGTKRILEGIYSPGQRCIIIEDLFTSGSSALETVTLLEKEGLIVTDIAILIDRQQGGVANVTNKGYNVHAVYTLEEITSVLLHHKRIDMESYHTINAFTAEHQCTL